MIDLNNLITIPEEMDELFNMISENSELPHYGKVNCYSCKLRGTVPGSAHSSCKFLDGSNGMLVSVGVTTWGGNAVPRIDIGALTIPIVGLSRTGLLNGWAHWPIDFDPAWVLWCIAYKEKD